ncbi:MAG: transglutaminase-like cysteine peptidase [Pseudomonas sp.]|uniref:transglutaminase-like cysteine peptidase n=1 Tax=Pseudomonas sp. TaxID=306 RepID=UPI003BB78E02
MIKLHVFVAIFLGFRRPVLLGLLMSGSLLMGAAKATPISLDKHRDEQAVQRVQDWQSLIAHSLQLNDVEKLQVVNAFFNRHIRYGEDAELWQQSDYWASPQETLERGAGDCEDFALAKYFTLRLLGIPENNLRLVYSTLTAAKQTHMVLGFWGNAETEPVLLDNLSPAILPIAQRRDLQMHFAFGETHLYRFEQSNLQVVGKAEFLPHWPALMTKLKHDGLFIVSGSASPVSRLFHLAANQTAQSFAAHKL